MRLSIFLLFIFVFPSLLSAENDLEDIHKRIFSILHSHPTEAYILAQQAEELAHQKDLYLEEANYVFVQAWINEEIKLESGKAFIQYLKALEIIRPYYHESEKGAKRYIALLLNTGNILREHHAYNEAEIYYNEGIHIALKYKPEDSIVRLFWNKAKLNRVNENNEIAIESIEKGIQYAKLIDDQNLIFSTINEKGLLQIELKQFNEARLTYEAILNLSFIDKLPESKAVAWHNIGHAYASEKKYVDAIKPYKQAEILKSKLDKAELSFITWTDLCQTYKQLGDFEKAEEYGSKAETLYDKIQLLPENYRIYEYLSYITFERGDYKQSRAYTEKYISENKKFIDLQKEVQVVKDQYKMEVLAAGFFMQMNSSKSETLYATLLAIVTSLFTIILLAGLSGQFFVRRSIRKTIQNIEKNSLV
ncbi:MAG: tetratricopeptide (TPR) repeat protein [Cyclobacteriaceae bacterium]|jgi:tetratricopeptide (TPR) repeat protein